MESRVEELVWANSDYNIVATVRVPLLLLSGDLRVVSAKRAFSQLFQVDPQATQDQFI